MPLNPHGARLSTDTETMIPGEYFYSVAESSHQQGFQRLCHRIQAGQGFAGNIQLFSNLQSEEFFFCTLNSQPASMCGKQ